MNAEQLSGTFWSLITPELIPAAAAVYGVCAALKASSKFPDRFIPLAALACGIGAELALNWSTAFTERVIRGILCGMAAVYAANLRKQFSSKGDPS